MRGTSAWLLGLVLLATGCGSGSGSPGTSGQTPSSGGRAPGIVTKAEAMAAFTTYADATSAAQVAAESGVLQLIDQAQTRIAAVAGAATPAPAAAPSPVAASDLAVFVPFQRAYPALFIGERTLHPTTGPSAGKSLQELWVFRRDAQAAPWLAVAQASGGDSGLLPQLAQDADGYIKPVAPGDAQRFALDPGTVPTALAGYLQTMHPPMDEFVPGPGTTGLRASDEQLAKDAQRRNTLVGIQYHADTYPDRFTFQLASGGALEVFTLERSEVFSGASGGPGQLSVTPDPTAVVGLNDVAPGTYQHIIYSYGFIVLALDPPKAASTGMVTVLSTYSGY